MLLYVVPPIAFIAIFVLMWGAYRVWIGRFDSSARRTRQRVSQVLELSRVTNAASLDSDKKADVDPLEAYFMQLAFVRRLSKAIDGSGFKWTLEQHALLSAGGLILGFALIIVLLGSAGLALIGGIIMAIAPSIYFIVRARNKTHKFEAQLPDALDFISRALRSGHSLNAAFAMVAEEVADPVGAEFKRVVDELTFGVDFTTTMNNFDERMESSDLSFFVVSLLVQRTTGGNLAEVTATIARTVRERFKFHKKMDVLSAEGRISGIILGALPIAVGVLLYFFNPGYISVLWTTPTGLQVMTVASIMLIAGFMWVRQIVNINV